MSTQPKHTYKEAFMLMRYATKDGSEVETVWNSRDGITPFIITSRTGKEMTHVEWNRDRYAPDHKPVPGERIFVRLTEERALYFARRNVARLWDQFPVEGKTQEEYAAEIAKAYAGEYGGDAPDLITVGETVGSLNVPLNMGDADFFESMTEGLHVGSWCPTPEPTVPPTQVHLTIPSSLGKVLLRFKSTHSLDQLIAALVKHRAHVWGMPADLSVWSAK